MASLIVGVLGRKRSGKDTFAERLVEAHGFTRLAFADIMRDGALALDPLIRLEADEVGPLEFGEPGDVVRLSTVVALVGWERAKEVREVRRTLQRFGTEAGREIHGESVWVDRTMAQVHALPGRVVITDVRFLNEAEAVEDSPRGRTVRIVRPSLPAPTDTHPSETALDDYYSDHTVVNRGTVADLHTLADDLVRRLNLT